MIPESCRDGEDLVAEVDSSGDPVRSYVHGPGIDNLLAFTDYTGSSTNTYYALTDHLGTVNALADETGAIVESYEYDAWGDIIVYDENDTEIPQSQYGNRFTFQCREYSWATGLYNFRARWYDPNTSRWLSKDPIGISGGLNQYVPFANNPINFLDPDGLSVYRIAPDGTAGWTGRWGEVADEIEKGMAATADGIIPFADPYESYYANECGDVDSVYKASRNLAGLSRDLLISAAGISYASRIGTGAKAVHVSRWGRPGLKANDWVMRGNPNSWNYLMSGKYQPRWIPGGNIPASFSSGQSFTVPGRTLQVPPGFWGPVKGAIGQSVYIP